VIRINLLTVSPGGGTVGTTRELVGRAVAVTGVLMVAAVLAALWLQLRGEGTNLGTRLHVLESNAALLRADATLAETLAVQRKQLTSDVQASSSRERAAVATVELLSAVSRSLPDGVWLLDLQQRTDGIQIEGRAKTMAAVSQFAENLGASGVFAAEAEIQSTTAELVERAPVFRFRMRTTVR
jgi:Tfp pilus assembly protein PilN